MTVVNGNKSRKRFKFAINFIVSIVFLIYLTTILLNTALIHNDLGDYLIDFRVTIFNSVGISILITILFYISRIFPKYSFKRNVNLFIVSLLMLIDCYIWAKFSVLEFRIESYSSFLVDTTFLFTGLIILLSINVFLKGFDLLGKITK